MSAALPCRSPYLLSNNSEQLLKKQGKSFFANLAYKALTRSPVRKLSQEHDLLQCSEAPPPKDADLRDLGGEVIVPRAGNSPDESLEPPVAEAVYVGKGDYMMPLDESERGATLLPVAESSSELSRVDQETLIRVHRYLF